MDTKIIKYSIRHTYVRLPNLVTELPIVGIPENETIVNIEQTSGTPFTLKVTSIKRLDDG